ncbi:MAG: transporter substrate-binding domain-containing protein [Rhodocyclaceae bacterium]
MRTSISRRLFGRACGLLGALAFIGLTFSAAAGAQTVADIKKKGELTVGMLVDFPPYGILNSSNEPDGYDADVARLLAKQWGVKVNLVPVTGPNRIPYLQTNKVDLLIASLAITPERAKQVQFSAPYASASIMLNAPKNSKIKAPADLKGVKVAVARASTQDVALTAMAPEGTLIQRFDDDASAVQALLSGQVDAIGCSTTVLSQIEKRMPGKYESKFALKQQYHGIVMRLGQDDLLKAVNAFVAQNRANGEFAKLYQKWLGIAMPEMPDNLEAVLK